MTVAGINCPILYKGFIRRRCDRYGKYIGAGANLQVIVKKARCAIGFATADEPGSRRGIAPQRPTRDMLSRSSRDSSRDYQLIRLGRLASGLWAWSPSGRSQPRPIPQDSLCALYGAWRGFASKSYWLAPFYKGSQFFEGRQWPFSISQVLEPRPSGRSPAQ